MTNPYQSPPVRVDERSFWKRFRCGFNRAMRAYRDGCHRDGIVGFRAFQAWFLLACILLLAKALIVALTTVMLEPVIRQF